MEVLWDGTIHSIKPKIQVATHQKKIPSTNLPDLRMLNPNSKGERKTTTKNPTIAMYIITGKILKVCQRIKEKGKEDHIKD